MKLYLLKVIDEQTLTWDRYIGFVVMATSASQARKLVLKYLRENSNDYNIELYSDPEQTSCVWIGDTRKAALGEKPVIVLESNTGA